MYQQVFIKYCTNNWCKVENKYCNIHPLVLLRNELMPFLESLEGFIIDKDSFLLN